MQEIKARPLPNLNPHGPMTDQARGETSWTYGNNIVPSKEGTPRMLSSRWTSSESLAYSMQVGERKAPSQRSD